MPVTEPTASKHQRKNYTKIANLNKKIIDLHDVVTRHAFGMKLSSEMWNGVNMYFTGVGKAHQVTLHITAICNYSQYSVTIASNDPTVTVPNSKSSISICYLTNKSALTHLVNITTSGT